MTITRTYEKFGIKWENGSLWSGYQTELEAQATIDFSGREGAVERSTFDVILSDEHAHLYQPGVRDVIS